MARYKTYNYAQMKMVAVSYERQIMPGTFEAHAESADRSRY